MDKILLKAMFLFFSEKKHDVFHDGNTRFPQNPFSEASPWAQRAMLRVCEELPGIPRGTQKPHVFFGNGGYTLWLCQNSY